MRKVGVLVVALFFSGVIFAQTGRGSLTYVAVGGGVQSYVGEYFDDLGPGGTITPTVSASVGHWVSRLFALQASYNGWSAKGFDHIDSANPYRDGVKDDKHSKLEFDYFNVHADLVFDFLRAVKRGRTGVYDLLPYVGAGYARSSGGGASQDSWSVNAGLINSFRLSKRFDLNINLQATMVQDNFNRIDTGSSIEGMLSVTGGFTYKFCL